MRTTPPPSDVHLTTTSLPVGQRVRRLAGRRQQPTIQGVLAAAVLNFAVGAVYAWSVFLGPIRADLGVSTTLLTVAFSVSLLAFALMVPLGGRAAQRDPRRVTWVAALGSALSMGASGLVPSGGWLVVTIGLSGAAGGLAYATATGMAVAALPRHRGLSLGLVITGGAAGPILIGPLAAGLIDGFGWRLAIAVLGALLAATMVGSARWLDPTVASGHGADVRAGDPRDSRHRRLVVPAIWALLLLGSIGGLAVFGHAATIAISRGLAAGAAGLAVAAVSAGDVGARIVVSTSGEDRRPLLLTGALGLVAIAAVLLAATTATAATVAGLVLMGGGYGAQATLAPAVTSDHVRRDAFAAVWGRIMTAWGLAAVVGPLGIAWSLTTTGSYASAFAGIAVASALATLGAGALTVTLRRRVALAV